jgi:hypothetical protein
MRGHTLLHSPRERMQAKKREKCGILDKNRNIGYRFKTQTIKIGKI